MRRTFKRADGTEEVLEGTAEELAEYERKLKQEEAQKRPDVLKGAELDGEPITERELEMIRGMRKLLRDPNTFRVPDQIYQPVIPDWIPPTVPWPNTAPPWIGRARCGICGLENCYQTHILCTELTCSSFTLAGSGLTKWILEHPEMDWTHLALNAGGLRS